MEHADDITYKLDSRTWMYAFNSNQCFSLKDKIIQEEARENGGKALSIFSLGTTLRYCLAAHFGSFVLWLRPLYTYYIYNVEREIE
jgi:hypothetical protein